MIIARSPLRITLGGGGTDLPSYYQEHGGFCISAAIDKYVYVTAIRPFTPGIFLKYSELEHVARVEDVRHPIIREALALMDFHTPQIELTTLADIPSGTGLGSSGSFTTALLKALHAHRRLLLTPAVLAEMACTIELERLAQPIGKQDQYIAAYGGVTCLTFYPGGLVEAEPLRMSMGTLFALEDNLLLFFTGFSRSASTVMAYQHARLAAHDATTLSNLHARKALAKRTQQALERGRLTEFGELLHQQWLHKQVQTPVTSKIHDWYTIGRAVGALGGKLVGAGGGGFLMFYTEDHRRLRAAMQEEGLEEVRFRFDFGGTMVRS